MDDDPIESRPMKAAFYEPIKKVHKGPMLDESGRFLGIKITPFKPFSQ